MLKHIYIFNLRQGSRAKPQSSSKHPLHFTILSSSLSKHLGFFQNLVSSIICSKFFSITSVSIRKLLPLLLLYSLTFFSCTVFVIRSAIRRRESLKSLFWVTFSYLTSPLPHTLRHRDRVFHCRPRARARATPIVSHSDAVSRFFLFLFIHFARLLPSDLFY